MKQVLVTVCKGIIEGVRFFDDPKAAIKALSRYVKKMDVEYHDAALYSAGGLLASAKDFLDENDEYVENKELVEELSEARDNPIYVIGNPKHPLGFMVASPDDPLGYSNPVEALSELGQMRKDFGNHLKLYGVISVEGPVATKADLERHNNDLELDDFDYSLVEEHLE